MMILPEDPWMPLYLSCIAGASTCLGAAVVFCHAVDQNGNRSVSSNTLSFSLALAGSVMITVSVISLGPECLIADDGVFVSLGEFIQRLVSFLIGSALYMAMSSFAFPEPEEVLEEHFRNTNAGEKALKEDSETQPLTRMSSIEDSVEGGTVDGTEHSVSIPDTATTMKAVRSRKKEERTLVPILVDVEMMSQVDDEGKSRKKFERFESDMTRMITMNSELTQNNVSSTPHQSAPSLWISWTQWFSGNDLVALEQKRAWRVAMLLFVSLMLHNFPEGLAVAASAMESRKLGITVTVGIMIHNIPEGIAISIPCLAARPDSPWWGFALASLSGLAEPAGAFVAMGVLRTIDTNSTEESSSSWWNMQNVLAFVAGIMIMVALYELFPEARRHTANGKEYMIMGTLCGVLVMVVTEYYA
jgi:zinc transporter, ZIP family